MDESTLGAQASEPGAVEADATERVAADSAVAVVPEPEPASAEPAPEAESPEEAAARAEREAAEKAAREAEEAAGRAAADEAAREERAQAAVERLSQGAGWAAQAGVYYDASHGAVKATSVASQKKTAAQPAEGEGDLAGRDEAELMEALTDVSHDSDADALDDIQASEAEAGYVDPVVFGRMVAKVTEAVTRSPLQREIFYKVLAYCQESKPLRDVEQMVMALPGFEETSCNAYHFISVMEAAGGLERFELDEEGDVVDDARKAGLTDDEIDDLVAEYAFMTTPAGQAVVEQHTPRARIIELLGLVPERRDTYVELMEFLAEEPRTYNEVNQLLEGRDVLWHLDSKGNPERMQPSVFLDKLHDAAAIEWHQGWQLSEEGLAFLDELKNA